MSRVPVRHRRIVHLSRSVTTRQGLKLFHKPTSHQARLKRSHLLAARITPSRTVGEESERSCVAWPPCAGGRAIAPNGPGQGE